MFKIPNPDVIDAIPFATVLTCFVAISLSVAGCGGSPAKHFGSDDAGMSTGGGGGLRRGETGGSNGSGGADASGGTASSGGTTGSGGRDGIGGDTGSGGILAANGGSGTGGAASGGHGTGGAASGGSGSGGAATGGNGSGGAATGGRGTGGAGTGGASTGGSGTGGAGTGGSASGGAGTGGASTGGSGTGGAGTGGAGTGGAGTGGADTGGAGTGGAGTGGASPPRCHVVVNEVQTATLLGDRDEFVELYNGCPDSVDLSGYSLSYRSAGNNSGSADIALYVFPADSRVGGGGFVVIAGRDFPGGAGGVFTNSGLAAAGGAVAIRNGTGVVVDSVAYDTLTTANNFTEGFPAPNPPLTSSIVRSPNGTDTDNNASDFRISIVATPGGANL